MRLCVWVLLCVGCVAKTVAVTTPVAPQKPPFPAISVYQVNLADEPDTAHTLGEEERFEQPETWFARPDAAVSDWPAWFALLRERGIRSYDFTDSVPWAAIPADTQRLDVSRHALDVAVLSSLSELRWLDATGTDISDDLCGALPALLVRVAVYDTNVGDACITGLLQLQHLERVDLGKTYVTDEGVKQLVGLPLLSSLVLGNTNVTDASIGVLLDHFALKRLDAPETALKKSEAKLAKSTSLERLDVSRTKASVKIVKALLRHPYLQWLSVAGLPIDDAALTKLVTLRRLEVLDLSETQVVDLSPIEALERLTMLAVAQTRVADTRSLAKLRSLRYLDLGSTPVDSSALLPLQTLPLRSLYLSMTSVTDLSALASLSDLGTLAIDHLTFSHAPFSRLKQLHTLTADDSDLHDTDLDALPDSLRILHVARTQASAAGLARLARLRDLQTLDVSGLPLDEAVLAAWKFERLRVLNVSQTPLKKLAPLPRSLERLYLVDTAIGDADLPNRELLPKLERIDVRGTRVTEAALDAWLRR